MLSASLPPASHLPPALSPQRWPFSLEWLPPAAYLVGGSVRDALLGRQAAYLDLDFVLPEGAVQTAKRIANHYQAGYVLLDAQRQIARVVFEGATLDFAAQVGDSLEADLWRRDFTINAIAYSPHSQELLDPLQGYADLQHRLIRTVQFENLKEDPLRLLRAYRQAAQLGFEIEPETQRQIRQLSDLLSEIAAERIQSELGYLLSSASGTPFLQMAWQDGLLSSWLPHATASSLAQIERLDRAALDPSLAQILAPDSPQSSSQSSPQASSRSWLKLAKLAALLAPDLATAEQELWRLKYSRAEIQSVLAVVLLLPQISPQISPQRQEPAADSSVRLNSADDLSTDDLSAAQQYRLFRQAGDAFPALAVAGLAAAVQPAVIRALVNRYLDPADPIAHPTALLSGRDLITQLKLPASPVIGQLLEAIQLAHAEGKVSSRSEALAFARTLI